MDEIGQGFDRTAAMEVTMAEAPAPAPAPAPATGEEKRSIRDPDPPPPREQKRAKIETEFQIQLFPVELTPDQVADLESRASRARLDSHLLLDLSWVSPTKEFILIRPTSNHNDIYRRLVVNNSSTRVWDFPIIWSVDPATDQQYLQLHDKIKEEIYHEVPSWEGYMTNSTLYGEGDEPWELNISNREGYEVKAFSLAKKLGFPNMTDNDVNHCIRDIIHEKSILQPRLRATREFHFHLLDEGYNFKEENSIKYLFWRRKENLPFVTHIAISDYEKWFTDHKIDEMDEDKKRSALEEYHKQKAEEDCSNRYRYLKLKLGLAERLGIISTRERAPTM